MNKVGNGGKGHRLEHRRDEVNSSAELNGEVTAEGVTCGMPKIDSDIDACEVILQLAPETNGHVAVKAWDALGKQTGLITPTWRCIVRMKDPLPRYPGAAAQDHQSPTWSGLERKGQLQRRLHQRAYELIPWRT